MEATQGRFELQNWRIYGRVRKRIRRQFFQLPKSCSLANLHLTQKFLYDLKTGLALVHMGVIKCRNIWWFIATGFFFFSFFLNFSVMVRIGDGGRLRQLDLALSSSTRKERMLLVACGRVPWLSCFSLLEKAVDLFSWHTHTIIFYVMHSSVNTHFIVLFCTVLW